MRASPRPLDVELAPPPFVSLPPFVVLPSVGGEPVEPRPPCCEQCALRQLQSERRSPSPVLALAIPRGDLRGRGILAGRDAVWASVLGLALVVGCLGAAITDDAPLDEVR